MIREITWSRRTIGRLLLSLYLADIIVGIAIAFFSSTMNSFIGLLMVVYAAMPWMLILRFWPKEPPDLMRTILLIGGLVLNFILLSIVCRWLDRNT